MVVVAFSDAHIATPSTQNLLGYKDPNYSNVDRLIAVLLENPPDIIVNLGDWWEPYYDTAQPVIDGYTQLSTLVVKIAGNHDKRDGIDHIEIDGVRYEHGHQSKVNRNVDVIRAFYDGKRIVHGHTHCPSVGWAFDVGSVTFTGTYGVIIDGSPELRYIGE